MNLCLYLDGVELVDARPEVVRVSSKRDFQQRQKAVHPGQQTLRTEEKLSHRHGDSVRLTMSACF